MILIYKLLQFPLSLAHPQTHAALLFPVTSLKWVPLHPNISSPQFCLLSSTLLSQSYFFFQSSCIRLLSGIVIDLIRPMGSWREAINCSTFLLVSIDSDGIGNRTTILSSLIFQRMPRTLIVSLSLHLSSVSIIYDEFVVVVEISYVDLCPFEQLSGFHVFLLGFFSVRSGQQQITDI